MGSTETTLYTLAIYTSAVGVKKTRYVLACALIADLVRDDYFCRFLSIFVVEFFLTFIYIRSIIKIVIKFKLIFINLGYLLLNYIYFKQNLIFLQFDIFSKSNFAKNFTLNGFNIITLTIVLLSCLFNKFLFL